MFKIVFFFLTLTSVTHLLAADSKPLKIISIFKDKQQFSFERKEGDLPHYGISVTDSKNKKLYDVKVIKCGPKNCLGQIQESFTKEAITKRKTYLHTYNAAKVTTPAAPEEAPYVSEHAAPPMGEVYSAYLGYGSPLGSAVKLGFFRQLTKKTMAGPNISLVSEETDMVSLKASVFSFMVARNIWKVSENIDFNLIGEFGITKAKLDFSGVNSTGPKEEEATYLLGFGGEVKYHIGPVALAGRGGISKNGFKNEYENANRTYKNPYGKVLSYIEFGIYYTF